jgi:hypothetical protein
MQLLHGRSRHCRNPPPRAAAARRDRGDPPMFRAGLKPAIGIAFLALLRWCPPRLQLFASDVGRKVFDSWLPMSDRCLRHDLARRRGETGPQRWDFLSEGAPSSQHQHRNKSGSQSHDIASNGSAITPRSKESSKITRCGRRCRITCAPGLMAAWRLISRT